MRLRASSRSCAVLLLIKTVPVGVEGNYQLPITIQKHQPVIVERLAFRYDKANAKRLGREHSAELLRKVAGYGRGVCMLRLSAERTYKKKPFSGPSLLKESSHGREQVVLVSDRD